MTPEQLNAIVSRTGHERFRWLTSDDNPDAAQREAYRGLVSRLASGEPLAPPRKPTPRRPSGHHGCCPPEP